MANNIVLFPKPKHPLTLENVEDKIIRDRMEAVERIVDEVVPTLIEDLKDFNITIDHEKDIGYLVEVTKSCIYRSIGLYHPFQEYAEEVIRIVD